ncbi:MAG TPA: PKD domain-containing protein [Flavipsychrobacter sp.]|nr:PKD domain-containing protein [Flavipsychrobacter sp.]
MKNIQLALGSFLFLLAFSFHARATHVVGGEFFQVSRNNLIGSDSIRYDITFMLYMDCISGDIGAINREDVGQFTLFEKGGRLIDSFGVRKDMSQSGIVQNPFANSCITNPPRVCLLRNVYRFTIIRPNISQGYYVVQNNCCRNGTIVNISNPDETGSSYYTYIPPRNSPNNSAVFKNTPPQVICINNPFLYDHSATDTDGDSLTYEFGPAYNGHLDGNNNIIIQAPPFDPIGYSGPYTALSPMGGSPTIRIDRLTGLISGTPNSLGRFVVSVHCREWRDGVNINTVIRDYQFVVTDCSKAVVANMPQFSDEVNTYIVNCEDYTVSFKNQSVGGFDYHWDFGVQGDVDDTSDLFEPSFTYPDTGTFVVKLVVNKGSTCPDSIERLVKIYPRFLSNFTFDGKYCPNSPISFTDSSWGNHYPAISWSWNFADGFVSSDQNPVHRFITGGNHQVILISKNNKGCSDTARKTVSIERFVPFAGNDTFIVKGTSMQLNAQGGGTYTWTPSTNLSDANVGNPIATYPVTGIFPYNVHVISPINECEGDDSITITVVDNAAIKVPSGFTPNGDGLNDVLKPISVGYSTINYFRIYNRWGQQVFQTSRFKDGWDGNYNGTYAELGVYFWVLSVKDRFGKDELLKGDVTLIR